MWLAFTIGIVMGFAIGMVLMAIFASIGSEDRCRGCIYGEDAE